MHRQKGQTLVEFALLVPLFFAMCFGMIYGGIMFLDYLQYTGKLSKVYCVTADGNFAPNVCDHSLPKIPLRKRVHKRLSKVCR